MQENNSVFKVYRYIRIIISSIIFFIGGLTLMGFGIYYMIKPASDNANDNVVIVLMFIVLGLVALLLAVYGFLYANKMKKNSSLAYACGTSENINQDVEIDNIYNTKLYFHPGGKLNQSYYVENNSGVILYECHLIKFGLFFGSTYELVDHINNVSRVIKIGNTLTTKDGYGYTNRKFKIDGVNCWEYLRKRGYDTKGFRFKKGIDRINLIRLEKEVAEIVRVNSKDPWNEDIRKIHRFSQGCYRLEIKDAKLEDVVIAAIICLKVNMTE